MLSLASLEKVVFYWLKTIITAGRVVGSGGRVGSLDKMDIRLNSAPTGVELSWSWN